MFMPRSRSKSWVGTLMLALSLYPPTRPENTGFSLLGNGNASFDDGTTHFDWNEPLPHQRRRAPRARARIKAAGLPECHPTKGFRRSHKNCRLGSR